MKPRKTINQNIEKTRKDRVMRRKEEDVKKSFVDMFLKRYEVSSSFGNIDLAVFEKGNYENPVALFEAKKGNADLVEALAQLIVTVNNESNKLNIGYPKFMGSFNKNNVLIVKTSDIFPIFYRNDIDWRITPSKRNTEGFRHLMNVLKEYSNKFIIFQYSEEEGKKELKNFILNNFNTLTEYKKILISLHNIKKVYDTWFETVRKSISIKWDDDNYSKKNTPFDFSDLFIAELLYKCREYKGLGYETKIVSFNGDFYTINVPGEIISIELHFLDQKKAYEQFWNKYEKPTYEDLKRIIENRYLLIDENKRKITGSYYTPPKWVDKSQEYIKQKIIIQDLKDEYYIWDCAAGTGNLLIGIDKYIPEYKDRVFASTLEMQDIDIMKNNTGLPISPDHIFQFDFLNDEFKPISKGGKLPDTLYEILIDPEKRKKLIIFINPPFGEASEINSMSSDKKKKMGKHKSGISECIVKRKYGYQAGRLSNDLFILFLLRIFNEIRGAKICTFGPLKLFFGYDSDIFIHNLNSKYLGGFIVPSKTFDNVGSNFPIAFYMFDTSQPNNQDTYVFDVYDKNVNKIGLKRIPYPKKHYIDKYLDKYIKKYDISQQNNIAALFTRGINVISNLNVFIDSWNKDFDGKTKIGINKDNFIEVCVYFAVRLSRKKNWINTNDPFYLPDEKFIEDKYFLGDCLVFTLFNAKNKFNEKGQVNHFIPYNEDTISYDLIHKSKRVTLSREALEVLDICEKIYKYYNKLYSADRNDSFNEIFDYFDKYQNDEINIMKNKLKEALDRLSDRIYKKSVLYGFIQETDDLLNN